MATYSPPTIQQSNVGTKTTSGPYSGTAVLVSIGGTKASSGPYSGDAVYYSLTGAKTYDSPVTEQPRLIDSTTGTKTSSKQVRPQPRLIEATSGVKSSSKSPYDAVILSQPSTAVFTYRQGVRNFIASGPISPNAGTPTATKAPYSGIQDSLAVSADGTPTATKAPYVANASLEASSGATKTVSAGPYSSPSNTQSMDFGVRKVRSWGADIRSPGVAVDEEKSGSSTIKGTITLSNGSPEGVEVEIVDTDNGQTVSTATADADGYYEVSVPDGHYHVTAGATADGHVWETQLTSVSAETATLDFDLDKAGGFSMSIPATAGLSSIYNAYATSFAGPTTSSAQRDAQTYPDRGVTSYATSPFVSENDRELSLVATISSYASPIRSSSVSDRTTLELQNQILTWDPDNAEWYTEWFQQPKIVDSEDTLSVRSLVSDYVEQTEATVQIEYDSDGNGKADKASELVELGSEQRVKEVKGLPIDEDGFYRIKVTEYSGYYSIYGLNLAVTH